MRIINEPTDAAIAYGLDKRTNCVGECNIFVFDLGGGTFDVSLITIKDKVLRVKATAGNTHLGGEDFDNRMVNYFVQEFKIKKKVDIIGNPRALRRLRTVCERAKRALTFVFTTIIEDAFLTEGVSNVPNLELMDVTPLSLGWGLKNDVMGVVIPRNTSVPVKNTQTYVTTIDNQSTVLIEVYEGERTRANDNNLLGFFHLLGLPPAPRDYPFNVCFDIDQNGILTVFAMEKSTGSTNKITITNNKERLSNNEIKIMIREAEEYRVEDKKFLRKAKVMSALDDCVYKMRNNGINLKLSSQENKKINVAITMATNLLDENYQHNEIDVLEYQLSVLESMYERIMKL
ncbi:hypothetical protein RYX36_016714 [Vicia faba]